MDKIQKQKDFEERVEKFGEDVIELCKKSEPSNLTKPIVNQLIRSATSIGANYMEANCASSKKDFTNKIFICKKESQETRHWLRMLARCEPSNKTMIESLSEECQQLILIFQRITTTLRSSASDK